MNRGISRGLRLLAVLALAVGAFAAMGGTAVAKEVVYSNIVSPLPGNYASIGYAATSTAEYGGEVELAGTARKNPLVTVAMSSWACQYGSVTTSTCTTPKPSKKFAWPLTLNVYQVGAEGAVGAKVASVTHTFKMPYRPTVSAACAKAPYEDPGAWYDASSNTCFHGLAFTVKFHLSGVTLPSKAIVSVAYDTSNYGSSPVGAAKCDEEPQGCFYNSLNVATVEPAEAALSKGSDPTESQYVNSEWNQMYCGSSESLGTFAPSGVCPSWYEGDQPAISIQAG